MATKSGIRVDSDIPPVITSSMDCESQERVLCANEIVKSDEKIVNRSKVLKNYQIESTEES